MPLTSGPYAVGSFEDQFEQKTGQSTFEQYEFEVPFECLLTRASTPPKPATDTDAYATILKNGVEIVDAGPAPPNRNLPAVTNQLEGLALANIQCVKGDKIAVRLNLVNLNTIERCKVLIAYMSLISPLRG